MMRSLYSGVSGLQNHQTRMDVIGNNISNVNTIGFKKGRVNFQDMLCQTAGGAAAPNEVRGGINPKQVGLGVTVAAIDTIHTQGNLQSTGVVTDLALQGEGFFILREGDRDFYTRAGAFDVDKDGILVNQANGRRVMGWQAKNVGDQTLIQTSKDIEELYIPIGQKDPAKATSLVEFMCNLDKRTEVINENDTESQVINKTWQVNKKVFDNFGIEHDLRIEFIKDADNENQWIGTLTIDPTSNQEDINLTTGIGNTEGANRFIVKFDNFGLLQSVTDTNGNVDNQDELTVNVAFNVQGATENEAREERQEFSLKIGEIGSAKNSMTQFADTSTTKAFRQDGYTLGYLDTFRIDDSGVITGTYSNGQKKLLGQVALASFTNPEGLEKAGESTFVVTTNSGDALIGPARIGGKGKFTSGTLEMSNVDLAESFTDMIVTQRGFQANSRSITTSDQMLQELLTLKR